MKKLGKFINNSIRNKILFYFLILIIPIVVVMGVVSYNVALDVVSDMAIDSVENMVDRIDLETDRLMSDAQDFANMISRDSVIQVPLREPLPPLIADVYRQRLDYNYRLFYTNQFQEGIRGFYVIGENGARFKSTMMTPKNIDFRQQEWYKTVLKSDGCVWFEPHIDSFVAITVGEELISVGTPIINRFSGSRLGVVLADMKVERFLENYEAQLIRNGKIVLLDTDNEILLNPETEEGMTDAIIEDVLGKSDFAGESSTRTISAKGMNYLVSHKESAINGWKTVGIVPFNEISRDASAIAYTIALLIAISCVAAIMFALQASSSISRPIMKVRDTMKAVQEGDLDVRANVHAQDEVGQLATSFNNMIGQINVLIKKQEDDQTKLRKAEQRALQAQINPHFLYNTLDSISWMARAKNVDHIDETIEALTMLFRISLSRGRDLITLEDEVRHVHSYLRIQQIRYSKKMSYSIDVPDHLCKYIIVKMTLQPLVENAIYHGIKEKREKGMISITGSEDGDNIILKVSDTGKGMEPETLEALNKGIREDKEATGESSLDSYGVINVERRLNIYFGEEYGLHYESEYMKGTTVTVVIPKRLEGDR